MQPIKLNMPQLQQTFVDVIVNGTNTTFISINQQVGEEAARLRAQYNLRLPDALQIAGAIVNGCNAFLTNDLQLKRVIEIEVLVIDELDV